MTGGDLLQGLVCVGQAKHLWGVAVCPTGGSVRRMSAGYMIGRSICWKWCVHDRRSPSAGLGVRIKS